MKIIPSDLLYQRTQPQRFQVPICENVEFCIFARREITDLWFLFPPPPQGDRIDSVVLEYREMAHSNGN